MMTLTEIESHFYHAIDENRRTVAVVSYYPFQGYTARPIGDRTRVLVRADKKNQILEKLQAMRDRGEL